MVINVCVLQVSSRGIGVLLFCPSSCYTEPLTSGQRINAVNGTDVAHGEPGLDNSFPIDRTQVFCASSGGAVRKAWQARVGRRAIRGLFGH